VTHNSLEANQRPHISLIDRRHFDDAALPVGTTDRLTRCAYVKAPAVARPLTALSHINVPLYPRAPLLRASVYKRWLDDARFAANSVHAPKIRSPTTPGKRIRRLDPLT